MKLVVWNRKNCECANSDVITRLNSWGEFVVVGLNLKELVFCVPEEDDFCPKCFKQPICNWGAVRQLSQGHCYLLVDFV